MTQSLSTEHEFKEDSDWLFITQDNDGASIFVHLPSIPAEECEVVFVNIRIVPNKNSKPYRDTLEFLGSRNIYTLFTYMEQMWKIIAKRSSGQTKHFIILKSYYKDENKAVIYSCAYDDQESRPISSDDISKAIYYKILDVWAYGKEQIRNQAREKRPSLDDNRIESKNVGFSGLVDGPRPRLCMVCSAGR